MSVRYLICFVIAALCAAAVPAAAEGRHGCARRIDAIRVSIAGAETVIAVEVGETHKVRLLRSADHIDALALTDVDNDGDLDIVAASSHRGLLLWRNTGREHFEPVPIASTRGLPRPASAGVRSAAGRKSSNDGVDSRISAELPRASSAPGDFRVDGYDSRESDLRRTVAAPEYPGRAPPNPA